MRILNGEKIIKIIRKDEEAEERYKELRGEE